MKKLILIGLLFSSFAGTATHMKGGYISVQRVSSVNRSCTITIVIFTDSGSPVEVGGGGSLLDFGDGSSINVPSTLSENLGNGIGRATYSVMHTFSGPGQFLIGYSEPSRNPGIINMDNSIATLFYIETRIDLREEGLISTPDLLMVPYFNEPIGDQMTLSVGASSSENQILLYQLVTPKQGPSTYVANYQLPENIQINAFNGLITWDGKLNGQFKAGEYGFSVRISSFKEVNGEFQLVSTMVYDFQVSLSPSFPSIAYSSNTALDVNGRIHLPPGQTKTIKVFFEKTNSSFPPEIIHASELRNQSDVYSFTTYDSSTRPNVKVGVLTLSSKSKIDRKNPYLIIVRGYSSSTVTDASFLLFTQDAQPPLIDRAEVITEISNEDSQIEVYPNPSSSLFNISIPENQPATVLLQDSSGRVEKVTTVGSTVLDLRHYEPGFYFCTVLIGSKRKVLKLIKQ